MKKEVFPTIQCKHCKKTITALIEEVIDRYTYHSIPEFYEGEFECFDRKELDEEVLDNRYYCPECKSLLETDYDRASKLFNKSK